MTVIYVKPNKWLNDMTIFVDDYLRQSLPMQVGARWFHWLKCL